MSVWTENGWKVSEIPHTELLCLSVVQAEGCRAGLQGPYQMIAVVQTTGSSDLKVWLVVAEIQQLVLLGAFSVETGGDIWEDGCLRFGVRLS